MADTKIRKVLEKDGIKPVRLDIPNELQSGKLGCCGPSCEPFASKVLPNLSLQYNMLIIFKMFHMMNLKTISKICKKYFMNNRNIFILELMQNDQLVATVQTQNKIYKAISEIT